MGKTATSKLAEADTLDATANRIVKRDAESARELHDLARAKRKSAIKQMKRRPKKGFGSRIPTVIGG